MTQKYHPNSPAADALISIEEWQTSALFLELSASGRTRGVDELLRQAQEWKDYADRLRTIAEDSPPSIKQHLLGAATRWAEMARKAERLAEGAALPNQVAESRAG